MLLCSGKGILDVTFPPASASLIKQTGPLWIFTSKGAFGGHTVALSGAQWARD